MNTRLAMIVLEQKKLEVIKMGGLINWFPPVQRSEIGQYNKSCCFHDSNPGHLKHKGANLTIHHSSFKKINFRKLIPSSRNTMKDLIAFRTIWNHLTNLVISAINHEIQWKRKLKKRQKDRNVKLELSFSFHACLHKYAYNYYIWRLMVQTIHMQLKANH